MRKSVNGFTIVELLIVIVVIAIIAAISVIAYTGIQTRAHNSIVEHNLSNVAKALQLFYAEYDRYPTNGTDYNIVKNNGLILTNTNTHINTLLYCADTASPTSWLILAFAHPYPATSYRWTSAGERNSNSGVTIGSGTTTCQAQMGGSSTAVGAWAFQFATVQ